MAKSTFTSSAGDDPLIEALCRGWGVASRCKDCGAESRLTALQLLEHLHQHLDLPLRNALAGAVCRSCGGGLNLYHIQTDVPLPHDPSIRFLAYEAETVRERMKAKLLRYAEERAKPTDVDALADILTVPKATAAKPAS